MPQSTFLPAFAKGPVKRPQPPGRPKIEQVYHDAMEQGRFVEKAVGDAIYTLKEAKKDLEEKVKVCLRDIVLASDGMFPDSIRPAKYVIDAVNFAKEMKEFIDEIAGTVQALIKCIELLQAILKNMLNMLQSMLNSMAALLGEICNWNLPALPSFPNLLGDLSWGFQGFNLHGIKGPGMPTMDLKFSFPKCSIKKPNLDLFQNYPSKITLPDGNVVSTQSVPSTEGTFNSTPLPVNTTLGGPLVTPEQQADPDFRDQLLKPKSTTPFFPVNFNPTTDAMGSVPNPAKIINQYQMPPSVYQNNLVSLIPELAGAILPEDGTGNLGDPLTHEPVPFSDNQAVPRELLRDLVTLERVYDTRNPHLASAWILYLSKSRIGRKGLWVPEFQVLFDQYIEPSVQYLNTAEVPFNGFDPEAVVSAPEALPFLQTLEMMKDDPTLPLLLWKLSFIEASLLHYARTKRWDSAADSSWHGYTGDALDFEQAHMGTPTQDIVLDSGGLAEYPVTIRIYTGWLTQVEAAIRSAAMDILHNEDWRSQRPQFRFVYDQFALATEVDRFSQFWREWKFNFDALLADEDATVLPYILNYWQTVNSKVNPLTTQDLYDYLKRDTLTRSAGWVAGSNTLNAPHAMSVGIDSGFEPDDDQTGWEGNKLNVAAFLSRPDIKVLPINTQLAMLSVNQAYAAAMQNAAVTQESLTQQLTDLKALTASSLVKGFKVSSTKGQPVKPSEKVTLKFNTTDLDITGNVANPNLFIIQEGGSYNLTGTFIFDAVTTPAIRKVEIWVNDVAVFTDVSPNTIDQVVIHTNHKVAFKKEDRIEVKVFHTGLETETLISGYIFECMAVATDTASSGAPAGGSAGPFTSAALSGSATDAGLVTEGMPGAGVAASAAQQAAGVPGTGGADGKGGGTQVLTSGGATPVLSPREQLSQSATSTPASGYTQPPPSVGDTQLVAGSFNWGVIGSGLKRMPAGTTLSSLMAVYTNQDGKALPIHPETDTADVPYFDGVTLNNVEANQTVTTALVYGQEYQITVQTVMPDQIVFDESMLQNPPAEPAVPAQPTGNLHPGKVMFVGPGGFVTQDYDFVKANCRWIVAVGRATATDKFIYEPHIPMDQQGGGGGGPAVGVYTHTQSTPANVWTITHNLGRYVNVEVYDADGDVVVRDVTFVDLNTVQVTLMVATTGHAACA